MYVNFVKTDSLEKLINTRLEAIEEENILFKDV